VGRHSSLCSGHAATCCPSEAVTVGGQWRLGTLGSLAAGAADSLAARWRPHCRHCQHRQAEAQQVEPAAQCRQLRRGVHPWQWRRVSGPRGGRVLVPPRAVGCRRPLRIARWPAALTLACLGLTLVTECCSTRLYTHASSVHLQVYEDYLRRPSFSCIRPLLMLNHSVSTPRASRNADAAQVSPPRQRATGDAEAPGPARAGQAAADGTGGRSGPWGSRPADGAGLVPSAAGTDPASSPGSAVTAIAAGSAASSSKPAALGAAAAAARTAAAPAGPAAGSSATAGAI
jgi:hypothetical protein